MFQMNESHLVADGSSADGICDQYSMYTVVSFHASFTILGKTLKA